MSSDPRTDDFLGTFSEQLQDAVVRGEITQDECDELIKQDEDRQNGNS